MGVFSFEKKTSKERIKQTDRKTKKQTTNKQTTNRTITKRSKQRTRSGNTDYFHNTGPDFRYVPAPFSWVLPTIGFDARAGAPANWGLHIATNPRLASSICHREDRRFQGPLFLVCEKKSPIFFVTLIISFSASGSPTGPRGPLSNEIKNDWTDEVPTGLFWGPPCQPGPIQVVRDTNFNLTRVDCN